MRQASRVLKIEQIFWTELRNLRFHWEMSDWFSSRKWLLGLRSIHSLNNSNDRWFVDKRIRSTLTMFQWFRFSSPRNRFINIILIFTLFTYIHLAYIVNIFDGNTHRELQIIDTWHINNICMVTPNINTCSLNEHQWP